MDVEKAKAQVIQAGKDVARAGLIARTWGNVSCRTDEGYFAITASGREYETLEEEEIIQVNLDTMNYLGAMAPSSEYRLHREIYKLKEDVGFIIHTHQHNASAVSAMGMKRIPFDKEYKGISDFALVAPYGMSGSIKLAENVADMAKESVGNAVIMSNHGAVCYGRTCEEAFETALNLEKACGKYLEYIGVEPWDGEEDHFKLSWNQSPIIIKYASIRDSLPAYLDDFAQIIGTTLKVVDEDNFLAIDKAVADNKPLIIRGRGAMCNGRNSDDRKAISMIIEKNCRAALAGLGVKPIGRAECMLMRQFYQQNYSKLKNMKI